MSADEQRAQIEEAVLAGVAKRDLHNETGVPRPIIVDVWKRMTREGRIPDRDERPRSGVRWRCDACGLVSNPQGIQRHQRATSHGGIGFEPQDGPKRPGKPRSRARKLSADAVMADVAAHPGTTVKAMVQRLGSSYSPISRRLKGLVESGRVEKSEQSHGRGRGRSVTYRAKG